MAMNILSVRERLNRFTPLRYPGGKAKLASYVKMVMKSNHLTDGQYVEPYAGGAGVALELLFHEHVTRIHINDVSIPIYSFWKSVLDDVECLSRLIHNTPCNVDIWDRQKSIIKNARNHSFLEIGFATFFLNRTNRSGILNGGIIGGRDQSGPWKIDARYNTRQLISRIQAINDLKERVHLTNQDAMEFLCRGVEHWPRKTLIYCDPPYYNKGKDLYYDFYSHEDHLKIANFVQSGITSQSWIVSYDNIDSIREMYKLSNSITYSISYSARFAKQGAEIMFFKPGLIIPHMKEQNEPVNQTLL